MAEGLFLVDAGTVLSLSALICLTVATHDVVQCPVALG